MPPEPLPWDRRRQERTQSLPQQPLTSARWRESSSVSPYQHGSYREFTRWGSADFRRPPRHGRQGSWHFSEENGAGHGYASSRSGYKMLDDKDFYSTDSRVDGKYCRNSSRENNRGSYSHRDWRCHSWENCNGSLSTTGRPHHVNNERRSVDDMPARHSHSHTHSDFVNTWDQSKKGQDDNNNNKTSAVNGLSKGSQRDNSVSSIDWKPLKWNLSGSLTSRGSGFSHSSSSKSLGGVDSGEEKLELQQKNLITVQSPSGDAAACVTSAALSNETAARKKARLAWGEGLAKFEKKKPDTSTDRGGADKSPRILGFSDCASPTTPSVACSSSPGVEEKSFDKAANISNLCGSPSFGSQNHLRPFNLEKLDIDSIINMGSSLTNLLQPDDHCTVDSSFICSTAISKLLLWKGDVLKALEMTESEIGSLENELKSLKGDSRSRCPCPATSSSLPVEERGKACGEQEAASGMIPRPTPLKIDTCGDALMENRPLCNGVLEEVNNDVKDEDIDSPGTATSKFVEPVPLEKAVSTSDIVKFHKSSGDLGIVQMTIGEDVILATESGNDETVTTISGEDRVVKKINNDVCGENIMYEPILATNKELAIVASEVFNKLLPKVQYSFEISEIANVACPQSDSAIRKKIAVRKQYKKFKERVLTLKFKAFQNAWKEDTHSLSMRKYRAKSQKKFELSSRSIHGSYQRHRSIRSRTASSAGSLILEPNARMINFASKLLESHGRLYRNALKMPALILDEKEKNGSRFISSNGLVEDPCAIEKERALINPWTSEEKEIFMDKLAAFGKDFTKIASFLDHKTTADCVEFYYKNHKSECFEKTKKNDLYKLEKSAVNTYLLTSGKKRSRELNAASLDVLGAASVIAAQAESDMRNRHTSSGRILLGGSLNSKASRVDDSISVRSSNFDVVGSDQEAVAADVLAGICGSFSSEAMSSCITSSAGPGESYHHGWKCHKVDSVVKRPSTSDVLQSVDEDTCSDESCGEMDSAHWTDEEKSVFVQSVSTYGKDFEMISRCVGSRSKDQCKVFFSKARKCLGLDLIHPRTRNRGTPMSDDANSGGTDTEDACVLESSIVCSDKLGSKVEEDLASTIVSMNVDESGRTREASLQTDLNISEEDNAMLVDHKDSEAVEAICSDVDQTGPFSCGSDDMVVDSNHTESVQGVPLAVSASVAEQGVPLAASASHGETVDPSLSSSHASVESKSNAAWSTEDFGNYLEVHRTLLSNNGMDGHDTKCGAETGSQIICRLDSNKTNDQSIDNNSCLGFSFNTRSQHQVPVDFGSAGKPSVLLLSNENSSAKNSELHDSDASQCEKICNQDRLSSTHAYQETEDKKAHGSLLDINVSRNQFPEVRRLSTSVRGVTGPCLSQGYLRKCNGSKSADEVPQPVQKLEQANSRLKSHSRSLSDTEKPCRNSNVKLFGQILTSSSQDNEKVSSIPKQSAESSSINFTGHNNVDGNASFSKLDRNIIFAPENVPKRSYGFWDGNRIQTGLSSLPDSAILVAKYPAAFVNYPTSKSQMEPQASQTVVRNTDQNSIGVSVFSPREIRSNNAVMDYQSYRGLDRTKVAPFTAEMKQQQEFFSEMQRQNGFDAISHLQQQGRGMVGVNAVGTRKGVVVGSSCPDISDPVAVLRMQFAKTEQYGQQSGSITNEESWRRGNGDMNMRR